MKLLAIVLLAVFVAPPTPAQRHPTSPVLAFPEPGLDDTAAYQGYQTRFFRDSKGNAVQIYLDRRGGRVVHLWADAANESLGFTVRGPAGQPAPLTWGSEEALVTDSGAVRTIEYRLTAESPRIEIGWFLLGSMRVERDFQYARSHLAPFSARTFRQRELVELIGNVERLGSAERRRHLALLGVRGIPELSARLRPTLNSRRTETSRVFRVEQPSFDGRNRLALEVAVNPREAAAEVTGRTISISSRSGGHIALTVSVATDAAPLTPLSREEIFNGDFLRFFADVRAAHDSLLRLGGSVTRDTTGASPLLRYPRLERQIRSVELLSAREKLMAGLPNFATYFGRDMMMTALMMEPVWSEAMSEHVIASVLRKLSLSGQVSHEEALGGQAIREGASEYNALLAEYFRLRRRGERLRADSILPRARTILGDLQAVRENYHMLDDEFQLPVLAARYLSDPDVGADRKRDFLLATSHAGVSRLALLLRELSLVATMADPYAREQLAGNLVGFPKRDSTHWHSGSWRDSGAGYANGRFAMDINVIWVPQALASIERIFAALRTIGFTRQHLDSLAPAMAGTPLGEYTRDPESLRRAVQAWDGAARHFTVSLSPREIQEQVRSKLSRLSEEERSYWDGVLAASAADRDSLEFLALSLDAAGRPIPVANTDPATRLFLEDATGGTRGGALRPDLVLRDVRIFVRPYPVGLFVEGLGPLVANDAYATPQVWEAFGKDLYHSPRVVWGREVNLLFLGLARQMSAALDASGGGQSTDPGLEPYVRELDAVLRRTIRAVEASGLKHNELWSYRIEGGRLFPVRYGTSSDIQLWNTTDLAVQFVLSRLPRL